MAAAGGLNPGPVCAAKPGDINSRHPHFKQFHRQRRIDAGTDLLDQNRHCGAFHQISNGLFHPRPVGFTFWLHRLLQRVEMNRNGVRLQIIDRGFCQIEPAGLCQLDTPQIANNRNMRRQVTQLPRCLSGFQTSSLRPHSKRNRLLLRSQCQRLINLFSPRRTAGHRADHERRR